jgi:hypothetical protein
MVYVAVGSRLIKTAYIVPTNSDQGIFRERHAAYQDGHRSHQTAGTRPGVFP